MREGWTRLRFDEFAENVTERVDNPAEAGVDRYVGLEHLDPDSLAISRWGAPTDVGATKLRFRSGDIIFGKRRVYQKKLAVADFNGICSAHAMVLRARPRAVDPAFLPYLMQTDTFMERALRISVGSLSPTINWPTLAAEMFDLPPRRDQGRIADLLRAEDATAEAMRNLQLESERAQMALFSALVARSEAKETSLGDLLAEPPKNGYSAVESPQPTGHWVLALSALTRSGYRRGELKAVEKSDQMAAAILRAGDLLISRSNTRELVGLPGIFDEDREDVSWPDTMTKVTPDERRLRRRFLEIFLRGPAGRCQIQSLAAGTSSSMKKINGENVRKVRVPVPAVEVQDAIIRGTDSVQAARDMARSRLSQVQQLKRMNLSSALSAKGDDR